MCLPQRPRARDRHRDVRSVRESGLQKLCSCWGRGHAVTARPGGPLWSPRYLLSEGSPHRCSAVFGTSGQRMDHRTVSLGTFQGNTQRFSPPDARHGSWVTSPRLLPCGDTDFKPEGNPGPFGQRFGRKMRRLRPQRRGELLGNKQDQTRLLQHPLSLDLAPRAS